MKKKLILILLIIILFTSGCNNKEEMEDSIKIDSINDYYISYYGKILERNYKEAYAAYLYVTPNGTIESFKAQHEKDKDFYEFKDINDDGVDEFIIVSESSNSIDDYFNIKYINIYTFNDETKKVSLYLSGEYWDSLYYNESKNVYLSKFNLDEQLKNKTTNKNPNVDLFGVMEFHDYYRQLNRLEYYNDRDIFILYNDKTLLTRNDFLNGNIPREEGHKYISNLKKINLSLNDLSEIYDITYDDKMLESIDKQMKDDKNISNSNLSCTSEDVDNIIKSLEQGKNVRIDRDGDIKFDKQEGNQFYNKEYPYFSEYTISCGTYSRTIRISHK